jgi:hypothetical protein
MTSRLASSPSTLTDQALTFESYRQLVIPHGWVISPSQGRYLHTAAQTQNNSRQDIHASRVIRTHDSGV